MILRHGYFLLWSQDCIVGNVNAGGCSEGLLPLLAPIKATRVGRRSCIKKNWSSGNGKRLTFQRSWVRIPAPYIGWTFFTYICCKNCGYVCLKRPKINEKEAGVGPFFLKKEKL